MTPLFGASEEVAEFVKSRIPGCERGFGRCQAIGIVDNDGELIAGCVYHNWHPETGVIEMSSASVTPRWVNKEILRLIFGYPFDIGCQLIVLRTDEDNKRLHRQLYALGFRSHTIPRLRGRNKAEIIFTLTDDDWLTGKFTRDTHGKIKQRAQAA